MDRNTYERMSELEERHWWFSARRSIIEALINRLLATGNEKMILEAGCGTGGNIAMLQKFGHVDAFELDENARQDAINRTGIDIQFGALPHTIPFKHDQYDLIGLFDVLEHVEEDAIALYELSKYLNAKGKILITVPAFPSLWSKHDDRHHHFRRYTQSSLELVAQEAGLQVLYVSYFNTGLFPLAVVTRTVKRLLHLETPDDKLPGVFINTLLMYIFGLERHLLGRFRLPFGLSLLAVLERT